MTEIQPETESGQIFARPLLHHMEDAGASIGSFTDQLGIKNYYYFWRADDAKAVVQLSHGIGEYVGRYIPFVHHLVSHGYSVIGDDHRGHGATGLEQWAGHPDYLGRPGRGGLKAAIRNVRTISSIAKTVFPGQRLALLGHSWGSLMAQRMINRHGADYAAVVLTGTAYALPGFIGTHNFNAKFEHPGCSGFEWLSRDERVGEAFAIDPYTSTSELTMLLGIPDAARLLVRPSKFVPADLPLLLANGSDDPVGGPSSVLKLSEAYAEVGVRDVTVKIYPQARHEVLNEINRDEVITDIVEWLDGRLA